MVVRRMRWVVVASFLFGSCGGSSASQGASRERNATLSAVSLANPTFTATGGGWTGQGFALGSGCKAGGGDPSLGTWLADSLAFGYLQRTVAQSVSVPVPGLVTLSFDGVLRGDDTGSTFQGGVSDSNETVSTGVQTGAALTTSRRYSLSVTTTSPNETVTVSFSGKSGHFWAGCYGAIIRNAAITTPSSTTTTVTATTTSLAPATTMAATTTSSPAPEVIGSGPNGTFVVGDQGPGGGKIVWREFTRDTTAMSMTERYLEVAPTGWSGADKDPYVEYGNCSTWLGTSDGIGNGLTNTNALAQCIAGDSPARTVRAYRGGGKSDWYIPTLAELREMNKVRGLIGTDGTTNPEIIGYYWSSIQFSTFSVSGGSQAYASSDYNINEPPISMYLKNYVRPVRFGSVIRSIKTCSTAANCKVWDIGPGGGQVFLSAASPGNTTGKAFELVNGPIGNAVRGCVGVAGSIATGIGDGPAATAALASTCTDASSFAVVAGAYNGGGKTDWFVPSRDELVAAARDGIGYSFMWAWTSSSQSDRITTYQFDVTARDLSISASGGTNSRPVLPARLIP